MLYFEHKTRQNNVEMKVQINNTNTHSMMRLSQSQQQRAFLRVHQYTRLLFPSGLQIRSCISGRVHESIKMRTEKLNEKLTFEKPPLSTTRLSSEIVCRGFKELSIGDSNSLSASIKLLQPDEASEGSSKAASVSFLTHFSDDFFFLFARLSPNDQIHANSKRKRQKRVTGQKLWTSVFNRVNRPHLLLNRC